MAEPPSDLYQPNGVLSNRLGIVSKRHLEEAERRLPLMRSIELAKSPHLLPMPPNFARLKAIHHHLFKDLFIWAGQPRTWDIAKAAPDGMLSHFIAGAEVETVAATIFDRLASADYLDGFGDETPGALAIAYSDINVLHPFPEGNGRAQRAYIQDLATQRGYHLAFDILDRSELLTATVDAGRGDPAHLQGLFNRMARSLEL